MFSRLVVSFFVLLTLTACSDNDPEINYPAAQTAFHTLNSECHDKYESGLNEIQKSETFNACNDKRVAFAKSTPLVGWIGQIDNISTSQGATVTEVDISAEINGFKVTYQTDNNQLTEAFAANKTMIQPDSQLFKKLEGMKVGEEVYFDAEFLPDESDSKRGLWEASLTEDGSMSDPDFIVRFSDIRPYSSSSPSQPDQEAGGASIGSSTAYTPPSATPAGDTSPTRIQFVDDAIRATWDGTIHRETKKFVLGLKKGQTLKLTSEGIYTWSITAPNGEVVGCDGGSYCVDEATTPPLKDSGDYVVSASYRFDSGVNSPAATSRKVAVAFERSAAGQAATPASANNVSTAESAIAPSVAGPGYEPSEADVAKELEADRAARHDAERAEAEAVADREAAKKEWGAAEQNEQGIKAQQDSAGTESDTGVQLANAQPQTSVDEAAPSTPSPDDEYYRRTNSECRRGLFGKSCRHNIRKEVCANVVPGSPGATVCRDH